MNKSEFKDMLKELNWTEARFGKALGLERKLVKSWEEIPLYAEAYIELCIVIERMR